MGRFFQLFCIIDGAFGAVFALGLLVLPTELMQLFAVQLDPSGVLFAQATGAVLLGCSLVLLAVRNAPASSEVTVVLRIFGFADLLLGSLFLQAAHAGVLNALGYGLAAVCLGPGVIFLLLSRTGARLARAAA